MHARSHASLPVAAAMAVASITLSCAPAFDFAPWRLPVPEGTTTHGYLAVPPAQRQAEAIDLITELVVGDDGEDFNDLFGRTPPRLAVAGDGRIFVLDAANHRIQAYDANGGFVRSMGGRGQGPGEFQQPVALIIDGDSLLAYDVVNRRASRWSYEGELLESYQPEAIWGGLIVPVGNGGLVWRQGVRRPDGRDLVFQRVNRNGAEIVEYAKLPWPERVIDPPIGEIVAVESNGFWVGTVPPGSDASAAGDVYVSPFDEYQVFAYAPLRHHALGAAGR